MPNLNERLERALQKLGKWRTVFASWQLGTRHGTDPECAAVKDHRELTILLRAEVTTLTRLLLEKGVCTQEELQAVLLEEVDALDRAYEGRFPGFQSTADGMVMDVQRASETIRRGNWPA
jgi:hypothetical protein